MTGAGPPVVTFTTDYGPGSEHVGALHAVVVASVPRAVRVDLAHDIPPGQVRWGAVQLARLVALLPAAIHVAVVDPGVGTPTRRPLAVALASGGALVGPDNGLLGPAAARLGAVAAVEIDPARLGGEVHPTFHGRDVFAPAAARLAAGAALGDLGPPADPAGIVHPPMPAPRIAGGALEADVLGADRFGNVALLAGGADLTAAGLVAGDAVTVDAGGGPHPALVGRVFADAAPGGLVVYVDAHGHVAVAVNEGDAETRLGAGPGRVCRVARRSVSPVTWRGGIP